MELKPILYLLAAITWYFFKKANADKTEKPITFSKQTPDPPFVKTSKAVLKTSSNKPIENKEKGFLSKELASNRKMFNVKTESNKPRIKLEKPTAIGKTRRNNAIPDSILSTEYLVIESENANTSGDSSKSIGNIIGDKFRSADYDWKQTMVINELLRPVYF